ALRAHASPETRVRIELARPHPAALDTLRAVAGIHDLAAESATPSPFPPVGERAGEGGESPAESASATVLTYSTASPATTNPEAIARLSAAGALIVSVTRETRTLEDVYAAAMGAEEAAESAVALLS
ncbi:MAG TPA: hypothetical protein VFY89_00525, partial [Ktedonobacterales bacterium]